MPVFYLNSNLTIAGELHKKHTLDPLVGVSAKSRAKLLDQGLIRELQTPPVATFVPLQKYAKLLTRNGVETLGDFAFADLGQSQFRIRQTNAAKELAELQLKVRDLIHPKNRLPVEDCGCGDSPSPLPYFIP